MKIKTLIVMLPPKGGDRAAKRDLTPRPLTRPSAGYSRCLKNIVGTVLDGPKAYQGYIESNGLATLVERWAV